MIIKIFLQKGSDACQNVLEKLNEVKDRVVIQLFDMETKEGLVESDFYDIQTTPTTIVVDENEEEVTSWRGEIPDVNEIDQLITSGY